MPHALMPENRDLFGVAPGTEAFHRLVADAHAEAAWMRRVVHPHIVPCLGVATLPGDVPAIVMPRARSDLRGLLTSLGNGCLDVTTLLRMLQDVLRALVHMHTLPSGPVAHFGTCACGSLAACGVLGTFEAGLLVCLCAWEVGRLIDLASAILFALFCVSPAGVTTSNILVFFNEQRMNLSFSL